MTISDRITRPAATACLLAALLAGPATAQQDPSGSFEEEGKLYEVSLRRRAFYLRALAAERFARTRDARALRVLLARYLQPEEPGDAVRALLAGVVGDAFQDAAHVPLFQEATKRAATAPDAWLWYHALGLEARHAGAAPVMAVAQDARRDAFVRAAALAVLAGDEGRAGEALACVPAVLTGPAAARLRGAERTALLEACAELLAGARARVAEADYATALSAVAEALDDKKTPLRAKLVVARALARALGSDVLHLEGAAWRARHQARAAEAQAPTAEGATRARVQGGGLTTPRFLGIEGAGVRVAFVVDLSDSMLAPLTREELQDLRTPTGGAAAGGAAPTPDPDADLPWDRIKNRFDCAREALRRSLLSLGEEMRFSVIVFGTKAEPLLGTSLVRATRQNVQRVVAALDAIRPGKPANDRPHGTLKGFTNLHGGLRAAFRLTEAAPITAQEHVAAPGFDTGCDTIFLLSDGAPSWDDYDAEDVAAEGMEAGDPETGESDGASEELHYYGPYVEWRFLLADVARMNLFRKVELHCIGIGEAEPELLRELAEAGRGQLRTIPAAR